MLSVRISTLRPNAGLYFIFYAQHAADVANPRFFVVAKSVCRLQGRIKIQKKSVNQKKT